MVLRIASLALLLLCSYTHAAQDIAVPPELESWVPWVLEGKESVSCPFEYRDAKSPHCAWPNTLALKLDAKGGSFSQTWQVYEKSWIALPGSQKYWPQGLSVDGKPYVVADRKGVPSIYLTKGKHHIAGSFVWNRLPESIDLPKTTGLVDVEINKKYIEFPRLEAEGRLWLNDTANQSMVAVENRLQVDVFRRVIDDVPMRIITQLDLNVVGQPREVMLGPLLSDNDIPLSLTTQLPARLEVDGKLRMQVRPGQWIVQIESRQKALVDQLSLIPSDLPEAEIWVFDARPSLRLVEIKGVSSVDPRQTRLPSDWQNLPAYRVSTSDTLQIVTKRRGDPDPTANELTMTRNLWLDFDGGGYTFTDSITGQMRQGWRLSMTPEMTLGRAMVNGVDQLVTHLKDGAEQGIEVRQGAVSIKADGRFEGDISKVPAIGWMDNFTKVQATLHLPPGWRLFAASGADSVGSASWVDRWSLLDIFLVLIVALAVHRLFGGLWGAVALACFVISWHENGAPHYIWLLVIASMALVRVAPDGKLRTSIVVVRYLSLLGLIVTALPYMVDTVRMSIYPQLERPSVSAYPASVAVRQDKIAPMGSRDQAEMAFSEGIASAPMKLKRSRVLSSISLYSDEMDPRAKVQTGPGLPEWSWSSVPIRWNGPVTEGQTLGLTLMPPALTAFFKIASVLLILLLGLRLAGVSVKGKRISLETAKLSVLGLLLAGTLSFTPTDVSAEMPSPALLKELQERLLAPPKCLPQCAQISRMKLNIQSDTLRIMLEVHANETVAVPVPSEIDGWMPTRTMLDGKQSQSIRGPQNALWVYVPKGTHKIQIAGPIRPVRVLQLPLPLQPKHIDVSAKGWSVKGVHQDGGIEKSLQLERTLAKGEEPKALEQTVLPPFVIVSRIVRLGLEWRVETVVSRVSPLGSAIALDIPLLAGESVTTDGVRVSDGKANIQFAPQQRVVQWQSVMEGVDTLSLQAADTLDWVEQWRLDVSPIWHATLSGIPQIHHQSDKGTWFPQWRPWPGETLTISVTRPVGIDGNTKTIDHTELSVRPGRRATDVSLMMRLRSSQAGQHVVTLPEGATLGTVEINGTSQPIRQEEKGVVRLPIAPGEQTINVNWQTETSMGSLFKTPKVDVGMASVNASIELQVPKSRWTLFATGPQLGPAVLFWGVLIVIVMIAIGLGRIKQTPLKTHHWLLLGVGLSQALLGVAMLVVGWLFAMEWRKRLGPHMKPQLFNASQVVLVIMTIVALAGLVGAVGNGLLGHPDMQIKGNGSTSFALKWYADHSATILPTATIFSVPMWLYRALMLMWSLWLAFALLGWLKWSWECYTTGRIWHHEPKKMKEKSSKDDEKDNPWEGEQPKLSVDKDKNDKDPA